MFGDIIQPTHLLFILVVALLVLGPKRLPEVGRSLGKGIRDFRSAMSGIEEQTNGLLRDDPPTPVVTPVPQSSPATTAERVAASQAAATEAAPAPAPVAQAAVVSEPEPSEYAD